MDTGIELVIRYRNRKGFKKRFEYTGYRTRFG